MMNPYIEKMRQILKDEAEHEEALPLQLILAKEPISIEYSDRDFRMRKKPIVERFRESPQASFCAVFTPLPYEPRIYKPKGKQ